MRVIALAVRPHRRARGALLLYPGVAHLQRDRLELPALREVGQSGDLLAPLVVRSLFPVGLAEEGRLGLLAGEPVVLPVGEELLCGGGGGAGDGRGVVRNRRMKSSLGIVAWNHR